jgi:ribonucleoside-diphosphate reductase alpha chain
MDIYDSMCFTVSSAGGRRGAQMGTFDVGHPDVLEFIRAKREHGRLRQFNLSLLITDDFMQAVRADAPWSLAFPLTAKEAEVNRVDVHDPGQVIWRSWPVMEPYIHNERGEVACRICRTLPARELWDIIMRSTYEFAEPGFVLIDRINEYNNNWFCENIRATNPCGEQPLPPYGACLLGSLNLTAFVQAPFTDKAAFDWELFRRVVHIFTRMLDNVVEINGLPLEEQRREIHRKRRHGMGFLGLGSALAMLRMRYGSRESVEFTESVTRELAVVGWQAALELAKEKGPAPIMEEEFTVTAAMLARRPEMRSDGYREGDVVRGRVLHARYSRYMQRIAGVAPELVHELAEVGARFTHHSSIAPTGTISLSLANNASNGIEPTFAHHYFRNVIRAGRKTKERVDVWSYELLAWRQFVDPDAVPGPRLPDYFVTTDDITPREHVDIQAAAQKWIDSSISKTVNVPSDMPFEKFKDVYLYAHERGLKGCTTFRFNPQAFQGVLVKEKDLQKTRYRFRLESGEVIELRGDEEVEYDGEVHTAANLYDALKEGYFGKF